MSVVSTMSVSHRKESSIAFRLCFRLLGCSSRSSGPNVKVQCVKLTQTAQTLRKRSILKQSGSKSPSDPESPRNNVRFAYHSTLIELEPYDVKKRRSTNVKSAGTSRVESKAIRKTIQPILVFFLMWFPFIIIQLVSLFIETNVIIEKASLVAIATAFLHSSINPIVYLLTNKEINQHIRRQRTHSITSIWRGKERRNQNQFSIYQISFIIKVNVISMPRLVDFSLQLANLAFKAFMYWFWRHLADSFSLLKMSSDPRAESALLTFLKSFFNEERQIFRVVWFQKAWSAIKTAHVTNLHLFKRAELIKELKVLFAPHLVELDPVWHQIVEDDQL